MAAGVQDFSRTEFDRLNEIKGHLEIALLEKHFLREYKEVFMRWGGDDYHRVRVSPGMLQNRYGTGVQEGQV